MIGPALRYIAVAILAMPMALSVERAMAASFCSNIELLMDAAPGNFSDITIEPGEGSSGRDVTLELEGSADCAVRQLIRNKSYFCTWEFPHRDANAYATFEALAQALQGCIGDRATASDDQNVNHPDFYDSRIFLLETVKVAVSVKDKSALGNTFVFVFVEPRTGT
ncbi:MAG: hypothetical protein ACR2QJ_05080 [Geminicoccaceae bacterium]